jgi:predicted nucleotidyltransferase
MNSIFRMTNIQKVFDFLAQEGSADFLAKEIETKLGISKTGVHEALNVLIKEKLVIKTYKGHISLYSADVSHPIVRQWKVLQSIIKIKSFIERIKKHSYKIILFGSCAVGENTRQSDNDIFVISDNPLEINRLLEIYGSTSNIQCVVQKPDKFIEMQKKDPIFFDRISRGIVLWENKI